MRPQRTGFNLPAIKDHNDGLVLSAIQTAGTTGTSRAELAGVLGLTPQAISKIVGRLVDERLVVAAGRGTSTGGKPPTFLRLNPTARWAIGIHADRHATTAVAVNLYGATLDVESRPLGIAASRADVLAMLDELVRRLVERHVAAGPLLGVGLACPGPLDPHRGVLHDPPQLAHWHGYALGDALTAALGSPVLVQKDTDAAAAAVAAETGGDRNQAYVHFGAGLGAGLVLDGNVYRAAHPDAGEFGHQCLQPDGPRCECGRLGCLEAYCRRAIAERDIDRAADLLALAIGNLDRVVGLDRVTLDGDVVHASPDVFTTHVRTRTDAFVRVAGRDEWLAAHGAAAAVLDAFLGRAGYQPRRAAG